MDIDLTFHGAANMDAEVLAGPPGLDWARRCYGGARWQFFANGTLLFTPNAAAGVRDDLFPVPGAYSRVGDRLELHATRRADLGASVSLAGFVQDLGASPRIVILQATVSGPSVKILRVSQALLSRLEESGPRSWPLVPSTFAVTLRGQMGEDPFGPLESLLHLRPSTEGDPNPLSLSLESRDPNQQGSLFWTSFLDASEPKVMFCSVSADPAKREIVSELFPGTRHLSNALGPSWLRLRKHPDMPGLDEIPDWIYVEQGLIRLHLDGGRVQGEILARGQGRAMGKTTSETYEATVEGSLQETEPMAQPRAYLNPYAGETFFEGDWCFPHLGSIQLRPGLAPDGGILGDSAGIKLDGRPQGNVLPFSWQEDEGGRGDGFFVALSDRQHLAVLLLDTETGRWRSDIGERCSEPVPSRSLAMPASREELKYRGYDLVMEGRCPEAIVLLEQARALYRQDRDRTDVSEMVRDSFLIDEINILIRLTACYARLGRFDDLLASLRDHVLITRNLASREYLKEVAGTPGTQENLIGPLETYRRQLTGDLDKIQALDASRAFFEEMVDLLLELGQEMEALLASEKARARAFADLLGARAPMRHLPDGQVLSAGTTLPVTAATLRSAVERSKSTVVEYMITDQRLIVWVLSPQGTLRVETVAVTRTSLTDLVRELLTFLGSAHRGALDGASLSRDVRSQRPYRDSRVRRNEILRKLHDLLIAPISKHLSTQPGARITFVPQGLLLLVPFPALLDSQDQPLLVRFTPGITPAIGVLASLIPPEESRWKAAEALVVGNPAPPSGLSGLASLKGAEREARDVARRFGASALIGQAATEEAVVAAMPEARLIHLACHGLLERVQEQSLPGALVLAVGTQGGDGFLTSQEIAGLCLRADLVVLSACNSGLGRITGDGVVGLSRSFLTAGAKGVIVSLWRVNDDATAFLMTQLYDHLEQGGGNRAQALRKAMLAARERYGEPEAWAAFTFIGLEPGGEMRTGPGREEPRPDL